MKKVLFLFLLISSICSALGEDTYQVTVNKTDNFVMYIKFLDNKPISSFNIYFGVDNDDAKRLFNELLDGLLELEGKLLTIERMPSYEYLVIRHKKDNVTWYIFREKNKIYSFNGSEQYKKENKEFFNYLILNEIIDSKIKKNINTAFSLKD